MECAGIIEMTQERKVYDNANLHTTTGGNNVRITLTFPEIQYYL